MEISKNQRVKYLNKYVWILLVGLSLTFVASYMSISGLSALFGGGVIIVLMALFLEVSKLSLVTISHNHWKKFSSLQKFYMIIAIIILYSITSIGIFGSLKNYSISTLMKLKNNELQNIHIKEKIKYFELEKNYLDSTITIYNNQKIKYLQMLNELNSSLNRDIKLDTNRNKFWASYNITKLNLQTKNQIQKQIQSDLNKTSKILDSLNQKLSKVNDSLFNLKLNSNKLNLDYYKIAKDIGAFYSFAQIVYQKEEINSKELETLINWFILILIFVFDPVALVLILAYLDLNFKDKILNDNLKSIENQKINDIKSRKLIKNKELIENQEDKSLKVEKNNKQQQINNKQVKRQKNIKEPVLFEELKIKKQEENKISENQEVKNLKKELLKQAEEAEKKEKEKKNNTIKKQPKNQDIREQIKNLDTIIKDNNSNVKHPKISTWFSDNNPTNYKFNF